MPHRSRSIHRSRSRSRPSKSKDRLSQTSRKGWKKAKPQSVESRRKMYEKCGSRCFLGLTKARRSRDLRPSELKFPICRKDCKVDCRGLVAAKSRAGEWKYSTVYKKANAMINKGSCTIKSRSKSRSRSSRK
jgi:hypothetical protein